MDDVLDEGMSPPERPSREVAHGLTAADEAEGETLDDRLAQEEPDPAAAIDYSATAQEVDLDRGDGTDPSDGFEIGDERTGRLVADDDGADDLANDAGIDGAAASAEEAAVHTVHEEDV